MRPAPLGPQTTSWCHRPWRLSRLPRRRLKSRPAHRRRCLFKAARNRQGRVIGLEIIGNAGIAFDAVNGDDIGFYHRVHRNRDRLRTAFTTGGVGYHITETVGAVIVGIRGIGVAAVFVKQQFAIGGGCASRSMRR